jgi:Zn-dependent membrane protease YugP
MNFIIYFLIVLIVPILAQMKVKSTFARYSKVNSTSRMTGAEVARKILDDNGLYTVQVVETGGYLSDHYDPRSKVVRLSSANYYGTSVSGTAVAAHEVGHALQDSQDYGFLRFRHALVPVASISSNISWIFVMIGIFTAATNMLLIGIILLSAGVLFQLVTLPVEFNASSRALAQIKSLNIVSPEENVYAKRVLSAAALTYVAAAAVAVAELLRLVLIYTGINNRDN